MAATAASSRSPPHAAFVSRRLQYVAQSGQGRWASVGSHASQKGFHVASFFRMVAATTQRSLSGEMDAMPLAFIAAARLAQQHVPSPGTVRRVIEASHSGCGGFSTVLAVASGRR